MKRFTGIVFLISTLILAACQRTAAAQPTVEVVDQKVSVDGGSYTDVSAAELQTMLTSKDFTFVNVHIPFEGNIANTDLSIPYDQIDQNMDKLPSDKNAKIVLYCRSGRMSAIAAETLVGLGYTNLWNLSGGMVAWEQAGLKIDR
jgi:rhodanese-related sulfurtransferase